MVQVQAGGSRRWSWKAVGAAFAALVSAAACSSAAPETGPETRICAAWATECTVTGTGDCDDCESASCCADRLACYDDAACGCADESLDACLEGTTGDASDPAVVACWATFVQTGAIAYRRVACERAFCQAECSVPSAAAILAAEGDAGAPPITLEGGGMPSEAGE